MVDWILVQAKAKKKFIKKLIRSNALLLTPIQFNLIKHCLIPIWPLETNLSSIKSFFEIFIVVLTIFFRWNPFQI